MPASSSLRSAMTFALAIVASLAAHPASAQCTASQFQFPAIGSLQTTVQPVFSGTSGSNWVNGDHKTGTFTLYNTGSLAPTEIIARDHFDVTGVAAGTPVDVFVEIAMDGYAYTDGCSASGCCGSFFAKARSGTDSVMTQLIGQTWSGRADFSGGTAMLITIVAGTGRDLELILDGRRCTGGSHSVQGTAQLRFTGTNAGVAVVSCKGFGPTLVPTRVQSWGAIKLLYR